jgi:deoxyribodipyrimidine photo-lyase
VPELADLPAAFLDDPSQTPLSVQDEHGIDIGEEYPYPVVDFDKRRTEARETWARLDERAKEALKDPNIRRRVSLSQGGDGRETQTDNTRRDQQSTLDSFAE